MFIKNETTRVDIAMMNKLNFDCKEIVNRISVVTSYKVKKKKNISQLV